MISCKSLKKIGNVITKLSKDSLTITANLPISQSNLQSNCGAVLEGINVPSGSNELEIIFNMRKDINRNITLMIHKKKFQIQLDDSGIFTCELNSNDVGVDKINVAFVFNLKKNQCVTINKIQIKRTIEKICLSNLTMEHQPQFGSYIVLCDDYIGADNSELRIKYDSVKEKLRMENIIYSSQLPPITKDNVRNISMAISLDGHIVTNDLLDLCYNSCIPIIGLSNDNHISIRNETSLIEFVQRYFSSRRETLSFSLISNSYNAKITVIITCWNREKTIIQSVNSILNQSYPNIKVIIVDDNSMDCSYVKLIEAYEDNPKVFIIRNSKNKGTYFSKNVGLTYMDEDTEYVTFQDSDDVSHPYRIEAQYLTSVANGSLLNMCMCVRHGRSRIACITQFLHISVFREMLGFFGNSRFGADNEYLQRFLKLHDILKDSTYHFEYDKNGLLSNTRGCYSFTMGVYYFIIDDSQSSITKTIPLGGVERKMYSKEYIEKINGFVVPSQFKYEFDILQYLDSSKNIVCKMCNMLNILDIDTLDNILDILQRDRNVDIIFLGTVREEFKYRIYRTYIKRYDVFWIIDSTATLNPFTINKYISVESC